MEGGVDSDSAIQDNLQDTVQDSELGKTRMKDKTQLESTAACIFLMFFFFMSVG